jgi:Antirestriction protein
MAPTHESLHVCVRSNGYEGQMTADAVGITVCLFAFSQLAFQYREVESFSRHFHRLRDFALTHAESVEIFAAID